MTGKKTTKRTLLTSAISLVLCVSMLLGTTFAWFTDTATNTGNRIQAGTLDVQLLMDKQDGQGYVDISAGRGDVFQEATVAQNETATLWEPGKTQVVYLAIKNNGNLALKYNVMLNAVLPDGQTVDMTKVMKYAVTADASAANPVNNWDVAKANTVTLGTQQVGSASLEKGETHYFALTVHMDETADNTYQNKGVLFDLTVNATQYTSEEDTFGNLYDAQATFANGSTAIQQSAVTSAADDRGDFTVATSDSLVSAAGVASTNGQVTLKVTPVASSQAVLDVAAQEGTSVASYDIKVEGQTAGSLVTVNMFVGKGLTNVKVYHKAALMTNDNQVADGHYRYDPVTGFVTLNTTSFSEYTVTSDIAYVAIGETRYSSLDAAMEAATEGETVSLVSNMTMKTSLEINRKNITLDLNGNTLTVNGGVSINQSGVKIANGTIINSSEAGNVVSLNSDRLILSKVNIVGSNNDSGICIYATGRKADKIENCNISGVKVGINTFKNTNAGVSAIGTLKDTTISASDIGVQLQGAVCDSIENCNITGENYGIKAVSVNDYLPYKTGFSAQNSTITGTKEYAVCLFDNMWYANAEWMKDATVMGSITGCTLNGAKGAAWSAERLVQGADYTRVSFTDMDNALNCKVDWRLDKYYTNK